MPTFAAIPTMYAGVQFRSRLEARWAAFFDLIGWKWEYEPFDLPGYIPDFRVRKTDAVDPGWILCEVKPVSPIDQCEFEGFEKLTSLHGKDTRACKILLLGNSNSDATYSEDSFGFIASEIFCGDREDRYWKTAGNKVQWKGVQAK